MPRPTLCLGANAVGKTARNNELRIILTYDYIERYSETKNGRNPSPSVPGGKTLFLRQFT
jgi:hypothetical protein